MDVKDADAFLQWFEEDELYNLLDLRPCDVQLFVNYWNKHGFFGTWTQILTDFLEASFVESNQVHQVSVRRGAVAGALYEASAHRVGRIGGT
jgi:hypothetical protein